VTLDYIQWPSLGLGSDTGGGSAHRGLIHADIDPAAGTVRRIQLDDTRVELPRIDDRNLGLPHRHIAVAAGSGRTDPLSGEYDALRLYDLGSAGQPARTHLAELERRGPVRRGAHFRPRTRLSGRLGAVAASGFWLTFATDRVDSTSWLRVIPSEDPAQAPVARVRIPVRVPPGLHGVWLPTEE
jgi:carotenoid cleavage dioxygenase